MTQVSSPPIFIGGAGRSGTTLVRVILDSHRNIACGPELKVIPNLCQVWEQFRGAYPQMPSLKEYLLAPEDIDRSFAELLMSLLQKYLDSTGKKRIAEKSPDNVFFFRHLHMMFPESPLVQVIRDGRDVVCSLLTMNWINPMTRQRLDYTTDARKAAAYWANAVRAGRASQIGAEGKYYEIRYEQIVSAPEPTLQALFSFLGEPWDPVVLRFHEQQRNLASESSAEQVSKELYTSATGRWQRDLSKVQKQAVKEAAGDLLIELGYAADRDW